ncbi:tyrosine recombinase XerC [Kineosporia sp. A_224]|uniref:site-specific integrase n=1 Tax=Kineosporia sp. A_224 TaxID=1962180 RepID=UPI000B4B27C7|nr:tyrosine-type recombinase/integrase [Kineosporia sp. A_224]
MADPIKRVQLADGSVRYRFVIDIGADPSSGKRRQKTHTFDRKRDAQAEYARIRHEVGRGVYVTPSDATIAEVLDAYLVHASLDVEEGTAANYRAALLPVRARLGERRAQTVVEQDIDALVEWMLTSGRRRGGKPGTGLSARSVALTLGQLRAALNLAVRRQLVVRNVAMDTRIPRAARKADAERRAARTPWQDAETRKFLASIAQDRLHAPVLMLCMGLRPAEVCGLPWADVALEADPATLRVTTTRTIVEGRVVTKDPKSAAGRRTLPLPDVATAALRRFRQTQAAERLAAGPAYDASGFVLVDELGQPFKTDQLRRRLYRLMETAGVRKVRPYDARHACLTYLAANGVPDVVVSAWAGHADLSFTKRVYVHPDETHLAPAAVALNHLLTHA